MMILAGFVSLFYLSCGNTHSNGIFGKRFVDHSSGSDHRTLFYVDSIQNHDRGSQPAVIPDANASPVQRRLQHNGYIGPVKPVVPSGHQIAVTGKKRIRTHFNNGLRKKRTIRGNIGIIPEKYAPAFTAQCGVAPDIGVFADPDPFIIIPFGIQYGIVIYERIVRDGYLVRMPDGDVMSKSHSLSHSLKQKRIKDLSHKDTQSSGHPGKQQDNKLVSNETPEAALADKKVPVFLRGGFFPDQFFLNTGFVFFHAVLP